MRSLIRGISGCLALGGLAGLTCLSARFAMADTLARQGMDVGIRWAISLVPGNADLYRKLALRLETDEPFLPEIRRVLETGLERSPQDADLWMDLGVRAELEGDFEVAEAALLRAAALDREFAPAWALANFYFRRGEQERFWPWAQHATQMTKSDSLFRRGASFPRLYRL
jgi:tetratricopeptide (TPR) repeat protein